MLNYTILLDPKTKKNSQQIITVHGRPMIIPSSAYKKYEKEAKAFIYPLPESAIDHPVNVECHFYMATRRRVDLNNLLESATDVLVHAGVLADDNSNIVVSHDGSRVHYDKENPRTEIRISEGI